MWFIGRMSVDPVLRTMKLTLDTNCLINHFDVTSPTATSRDEIAALIRFATSGRIEIAVTTRAEADLEQDRDEKRRAEMLRVLGMFEAVGSVLRSDETRWDSRNAWADERAAALADEVKKILFPGLQPGERRFGNKIRDVDHIVGHVLGDRDIFVTDDNRLNDRAAELRRLGAHVMRPADCLAHIESGLPPPANGVAAVIILEPGPDLVFDCRAGREFRVTLDQLSRLQLPLNPRPGTYRLTIEQGPLARGHIGVHKDYRWTFADHSEFAAKGDLAIYQIEIFATADGFAYVGAPIFQSKRSSSPIVVDAREMTPMNSGVREYGTGIYRNLCFNYAVPGTAEFRVALGLHYGRFRFRLHWSHEGGDFSGDVAFRLHAGQPVNSGAILVVTRSTAHVVHTSPWSPLSESGVAGLSSMRLERLVSDARDNLTLDAKVHVVEIQSEPRPG